MQDEFAPSIDTPEEVTPEPPAPESIFRTVTELDFKALWRRTAALLREAREVMNNDGEHWTTSTLWEGDLGIQRYCVTGGLNKAAGVPQMYAEAYHNNPEWSSSEGFVVNDDNPEAAIDGGGAGSEYAVLTFDMVDNLYILDTAKHVLAETLRGKNVPHSFDPRDYGFNEAGEDEGFIITFNDSGSGMISDGLATTTDLPKEIRWKRIAAALERAALEADANAKKAPALSPST